MKDNIVFTIKAFLFLIRYHRQADILHCLYPNSSLLAAVLFKIFSSHQVQILYDVRSPWIEMIFARQHLSTSHKKVIERILHFEERILARFVDYFVFISQGLQNHYQAMYGIDTQRCSVLPTAVDMSHFSAYARGHTRAELGIANEDVVIGYIGTIDESRKLDRFLHMLYDAVGASARVTMLFLGDGNALNSLRQCARDLNLSKVHFLGYVSHDEIPSYIALFNFGLCHLPDIELYNHSFPLKILEYLASSKPVLASNTPPHRRIAKQLAGIHLYHDAQSLREYLKRPPESVNPDALAKFTWDYTANAYKQIYINMASG